jgi:hypothetical protein
MKSEGIISVLASLFMLSSAAFAGQEAVDLSQFEKFPTSLADAIAVENTATQKSILIQPAAFAEPGESRLHYALRRIETPDIGPYGFDTFVDQSSLVSLDLIGILGLNVYYGTGSFGWGESSFHFSNEGWFGKDTYALGMDKLGHTYATYIYADYFTQRIAHNTDNLAGAAVTGALLAFGVQTSVEIFDGFSSDYGFSKEDLIADGIGAGFSVLRNTIPGLAEKLDFRLEYINKGALADFNLFNDYTGQKYLLALKLSGFEQFEDTPLRFVELQAGYFARGFTPAEKAAGAELRREPYVAIGFNLQELLDSTPLKDTTGGLAARRTLEYIQLPYTYAASTQN